MVMENNCLWQLSCSIPVWCLFLEQEVEGLLQKHREDLVFLHVERLLREKSLGLRTMEVRHKAQEENTDSQPGGPMT